MYTPLNKPQSSTGTSNFLKVWIVVGLEVRGQRIKATLSFNVFVMFHKIVLNVLTVKLYLKIIRSYIAKDH